MPDRSGSQIDHLNIHHASLDAMRRAVLALAPAPDVVLVDAFRIPDLPMEQRGIVKGDRRCAAIAAASIVAKVTRDRIMVDLAQQHPGYGWAKNAGYPTKDHIAALQNLGVTPVHRRSFKPVHKMLYQEKFVSA